MPIFYFDLSDGSREPDDIGTEMVDQEAAEVAAIRFLGEVLRQEPRRLDAGSLSVDVRDAERRHVCTIEAVRRFVPSGSHRDPVP